MRTFFVTLFIVLASFDVWAGVSFATWQATSDGPRLVVPRREGESAKDAITRYVNALQADPDLAKLIPFDRTIEITGSMNAVEELPKGTKPLVALIANHFEDILSNGSRVRMNARSFSRAGGDVYVIALAADVGLSLVEAEEFRSKIARSVDLLVSMGGADIAPELYGEKITHAENINARRDRSELALVQRFKKEEKGVFFGICRGHQLGAVADGHKLYQDLSKDRIGRTADHVNPEGRTISESQRWHHIHVSESLLYRFLKEEIKIVNSVHHQAVKVQSGAASVPVAYYEGIVEALQMKNNLGLSVQFHPELPKETSGNESFSREGSKILRGVVSYARLKRAQLLRPQRCSALVSSWF